MTESTRTQRILKILLICALFLVITSNSVNVKAAPIQTTLNGIHRNSDGLNTVFWITNTGETQGTFSLAFYWPDGTHVTTSTGHILGPGQSKLIDLNHLNFPEPYFYGYVVISGYRTITARLVTPDFGLLTGTVYEPDEVTLATDTYLELTGPNGKGKAETLSDGKFYLGGMPPGEYKLAVTSYEFRPQIWDRRPYDSLAYTPVIISSVPNDIAIIHQDFNNYDPVADLTAKWVEGFIPRAGRDIEIDEGTVVTLDASWSLDLDAGPLLYRYDVDGDGVWDTPYILDERYEHTYVTEFEGTASVEIFDGELTDTASIQVLVNNYVPTVQIGSDEQIEEGDEVVVLATLIEKGPDDPLEVVITWGDGSTETYAEVLTDIVETREYRHTYLDDGEMYLQIMVSDPDGGVGVASKTMTVDNVSPILEIGSDVTLNVGETYSADISFQDPGVSDTHTVTVMWDDGTPDDEILIDEQLTEMHTSISHSYPAGVYDVVVTVSDDDSGASFYQLTVSVVGLPPVADVGGPYFGFEGEVILFEGSGSFDPDNEPLEYRWDFGGDSIYDTLWMPQSDIEWIWRDNYDETLVLEVRDATSSSFDSTTYSIANVPPVPFAGDDYTYNLGTTHYFGGGVLDPGLLDVVNVELDWGDGSPVLYYSMQMFAYIEAIDETHTYAEPGVYTISMYAEDDDGGYGTDTATITIIEEPPVIQFNGPYTGVEGDTIYFDASGSYDPEGESLEYRWDLDNDGVWDTPWSLDATASMTYLDEYDGTVRVEVRDQYNMVTGETIVTIENASPVLSSDPEITSYEGYSTGFRVFYSDLGILDTHTATVEWGDGASNDAFVDSTTGIIHADYLYLDDGDYTATVLVTDNSGASSSIDVLCRVLNGAPIVVATSNYLPIEEGMNYRLNVDLFEFGIEDSLTITYDWGDGQVETLPLNIPGNVGSFETLHLYVDEGDYTVTVTVVDDDGASGSFSTEATVYNVAPVFDAGPDMELNENERLDIHIPVSDPGVEDILQGHVNWGDGNQGVVPLGPVGGPYSIDESHIYADNGFYSVRVTVEDMDGGQTVDMFIAFVSNVEPVIVGGEDTTILVNTEYQLDITVTEATPSDTHSIVVDWGDGQSESIVFTGVGPTYLFTSNHIYTSRGAYPVQLIVVDDDGGSGASSYTVTVIGSPPVVVSGGPYISEEGTHVTFDASGSTDPDQDALLFRWDLDEDGLFEIDWSSNPVATYTWVDEYSGNVILEVQDPEYTVSTSTLVEIMNAVPVLEIGGDITIIEDIQVTLSGSVSDPGVNDVLSVEVNWGDGDVEQVSPIGGVLTAQHVYSEPGVYNVLATANDADGGIVTDSLTVTVEPAIVEGIHAIDAKPGTWPNKLNLRSKGILQVAICGAYNFDVTDIDVDSISVWIHGLEGPEPIRFSMSDVATPYLGPLGGGHNLTSDGYMDLVVVYELEEIVSWYNLQDYAESDVILRLESELLSGGSFEAEDMLSLSKYKAKSNNGKKK